ncbi:MAG: NAD-dependent epimerase/dehydratase family protein [Candidatus Rokubacteria bacterium]|nr:NAD-dependent epimerase/dehydratase family protein [Candidatus Rokubacteria bacterium]
MRVVVTGGCGFIGRNLLELARARGAQVRVLDDLSAGTSDDLGAFGPVERLDAGAAGYVWSDGIQTLRADIRDLAAVAKACRGAEGVVHLAASTGIADSLANPIAHASANVLGTVVVLEACRQQGVARCVVASSGAAVGDVTPPMHERLVPNPVSPYGASKLAAEAYCLAYRGSFGLGAVALRFSNVYGPHSGHKTSVVAGFIGRILDGQTLTIYGDGRQTRDFVFVGDLAGAIWAALTAGRVPEGVYQIASGVETSVNDLFGLLGGLAEARLGRRPAVEYRPTRAGEVARNFADITRARTDLGFSPVTPLRLGLETTFDWFLAERRARPRHPPRD